MITPEHIPSFNRLAPYMKADMLMLGRQTNTARYVFPCEYKTLDPDGGDFEMDLGAPRVELPFDSPAFDSPINEMDRHTEAWQTVFNIGTLEHVWDAHAAFCNAASMVRRNGYFLGQFPVAGWEGHGIHVTDWKMIVAFFDLNGFEIEQRFWTTQAGNPCDEPRRNGGKSVLFWMAARRVMLASSYKWQKPSQVYKKGVKPT